MLEVFGESLWWLGASLYITGSVMINLGSNLIRKNHTKYYKTNKPPFWKQWLALIGWALFGIGNTLNFVAFMFAAQSLCAALGSIQFVSNLIFAKLINNEKISSGAIGATLLIILGNVVIVLFGSKISENYDLAELFLLLKRTEFLVFLGVLAAIIIGLQVLYVFCSWYVGHKTSLQTPEYSELASILKLDGLGLKKDGKNSFMLEFCIWAIPICYAAVSAMVGANSVVLGKMSAGLIATWEIISLWGLLIGAAFILLTSFWLYRMNTALAKYDAMFIIPVLQTCWLVTSILEGGIFFMEFSYMTIPNICIFAIGITVLLCGVVVLSMSRATPVNRKGYGSVDDDEGVELAEWSVI